MIIFGFLRRLLAGIPLQTQGSKGKESRPRLYLLFDMAFRRGLKASFFISGSQFLEKLTSALEALGLVVDLSFGHLLNSQTQKNSLKITAFFRIQKNPSKSAYKLT